MRYYNTIVEEQETTINILYDEQMIRIYSNRTETIKILTDKLGEPTKRYRKGKTYWSGASWDMSFLDMGSIDKILSKEIFIDSKFEYKKKKKTIENEENYQITFDNNGWV